jgi:hypothetical protein
MARIRLAEEKATKADRAALVAKEDARRARTEANERKREAKASRKRPWRLGRTPPSRENAQS